MYTGFTLPFIAKKGEAFRLYFGNLMKENIESYSTDNADPEIPSYILISKDGAISAAATNAFGTIPTTEDFLPTAKYLDLTASEMNANVIIITVFYNSASNDGMPKVFIIYTDGFTGFASSGGGGGLALTDECQAFDPFDRDGTATVQQVLNALYKFLIKNHNRRV